MILFGIHVSVVIIVLGEIDFHLILSSTCHLTLRTLSGSGLNSGMVGSGGTLRVKKTDYGSTRKIHGGQFYIYGGRVLSRSITIVIIIEHT